MHMRIRKATMKDFKTLYDIGLRTPELSVSDGAFMDRKEFRWYIVNRHAVFLVAEENGRIAGFICANTRDTERAAEHECACIVYLVVLPGYRKRGLATALFKECVRQLKKKRIRYIFTWANAKSKPIQKFMEKQGLKKGHACIWMDKSI
jgi:N-acetylglutamate synthase-like GNAT family acetyltransferase